SAGERTRRGQGVEKGSTAAGGSGGGRREKWGPPADFGELILTGAALVHRNRRQSPLSAARSYSRSRGRCGGRKSHREFRFSGAAAECRRRRCGRSRRGRGPTPHRATARG